MKCLLGCWKFLTKMLIYRIQKFHLHIICWKFCWKYSWCREWEREKDYVLVVCDRIICWGMFQFCVMHRQQFPAYFSSRLVEMVSFQHFFQHLGWLGRAEKESANCYGNVWISLISLFPSLDCCRCITHNWRQPTLVLHLSLFLSFTLLQE